eukprot:366502-Chlamydomonas_euryale.AAC.1
MQARAHTLGTTRELGAAPAAAAAGSAGGPHRPTGVRRGGWLSQPRPCSPHLPSVAAGSPLTAAASVVASAREVLQGASARRRYLVSPCAAFGEGTRAPQGETERLNKQVA